MRKALLVSLILWAASAFAQSTGNGSVSGTACFTTNVGNSGQVSFNVSGTWSGTIQGKVNITGQATSNVSISTPGPSGTTSATITGNGNFTVPIPGFDVFQLCGATVTGTANIVINRVQQVLPASSSSGGGGNVTITSPVDGLGNVAVGLQALDGTALGAPSNYGTSPGAVEAQGVNAFVTNTPAVNVTQVAGGTLSKTNPFFDALTDGTNVITAALSAFNVAPTGTEVMAVNADCFVNGVVCAAAASGVPKVGITGNTGASVDSTATAGTGPTNVVGVSVRYGNSGLAMTNGQSAQTEGDSAGDLFVRPLRRSQTVSTPTTIAATSAATTIMAAQGANNFADIAELIITATPGATGTAFTETLSDGTASYIFDMDTGSTTTLVQNGILVLNFNPPLKATSANVAWTLANSSATPTVHVTCIAVVGLAN